MGVHERPQRPVQWGSGLRQADSAERRGGCILQGLQSELSEAGQLEHRVVAELRAAQARHPEILQQEAVRAEERRDMTREAVSRISILEHIHVQSIYCNQYWMPSLYFILLKYRYYH